MAGGHGPTTLHRDPAIDRHYTLRENYEAYYRWTPKNARYALIFLVAIPGALLYTSYKFEGKINFEAKKRGESIFEK
ncbi:hypothetical protein BZA70DRAFT_287407 [Myxozyma melibiosi]|uniref:NADH-ubiquinone oxidoreductase B15 subunit n=1 Tax=Myxozyma melibiosi TaxID=54550 RepID=A0ABR1FE07_9ASCO